MKKLSFRYSQVLIGLFTIFAMVTFSFRPFLLVHASPAALVDPPANEVAVKLKAGISINTILTRYNATQIDVLPENNFYILRLPGSQIAEQILPTLNTDTDLWYAEPNYYTEVGPDGTKIGVLATKIGVLATGGLTPTPAGGADQWAWQKIGLADSQKISDGTSTISGTGVVVAVLDTGMVGNHSLSSSSILYGYDFVSMSNNFLDSGNSLDDDGNGAIDDFVGHGTHISGIIVTTAPKVRLMPIRVINSDGVGTYTDMAKGIRYAVDQKVLHGVNVKVINMSITAPRLTPELSSALAYAAANGVIVVAAAGNSDPGPNYPAHYNDPLAVITVGATDRNDAIASFSGGLASDIDVFAPGVDIYSSYPYPINSYALGTGTSMAAPIVAGEAALLVAKHPDWSATEIEQRLISTGATVSGSSAKRINMAAALTTGIEVNQGTLDPNSPPTDSSIAPRLRISNNTPTDIPFSEIKMRYWYTIDSAKPQAFVCEYAIIATQPYTCTASNIGATFTTIAAGNANLTSLSDTYAEVSFTSGAGNLPAGASIEMYLKINKTDNSLYNELNDYSYLDPTKPIMTRWDRITLYRNGTLVWGVEPTSSTILTRTPTRTPTLYVPTATYTKTATAAVATTTYTKTPTKTSTSVPSATKTATSAAVATRTNTPAPTATAVTSGAIKLQLQKAPSGTDNSSSVGFYTTITNTGTTAISNISTRLYFTPDGTYTAPQYSFEKYYDQCNGNIQGPALLSGTTYYFTVTCSNSLAAGASWSLNYGFHLADWSANLSSTNDFWHTSGALPTTYANWIYMPVYVNGTLVWGLAP